MEPVYLPEANHDFFIEPFLSNPFESDPFIMPKAEHDIDLQCTLCKKTPKFSDVSHLLTHISSKSHLAAKFKLEIQSEGDIAASQALDQYNFWYHTSNIGHLLAERLSMKEQKQVRKSRKSTSSNVSIKKENKQPSAQDAIASTPFAHTPVNGFRAPIPRMIWPDAANDAPLEEWEPRSMYETPTATREVPNFPRQKTPILAPRVSRLDAGLATPWKPDPEDDKDGNYGETTTKNKSAEKLTDSAKLKGVIWPGMDIFDSATPELKRMRNQKKDGTNLEQMLITSRDTEPFEYSYHANGAFRGSRDVFAPPSAESSPVAPSPKKRKPRKTTTALSNKSTNKSINAPRTRAPRGKKAAAARSPQKQAASSKIAPPPSFYHPSPTLNPLAAGLGRIPFMPSVEEDEEFKLTIGAGGMGKKRRFDIYQDAVEASPARTETPLEEHRFDFQPHGMPPLPNELSGSARFPVSPTPAAKPAPYRLSGKENGQPEQPSQQHVRRTHSGPPSHIYPPHMLRDTSSINNPLYNHAYARSFGGFSQQTWSYNDTSSYQQGNPMLGGFNPANPVNPIARPQHQYGQGLGQKNSNNDFGMHYDP